MERISFVARNEMNEMNELNELNEMNGSVWNVFMGNEHAFTITRLRKRVRENAFTKTHSR